MTDEQVKAVNLASNRGYKVRFIKNGFVFMTSSVKDQESVIRIDRNGFELEVAE